MGARTQVFIKDEKVYLYSHWGSYSIRETVAKALAKKWRWDDPEYLARIIFDEMVGEGQGTETSFGIGTHKHDDLDNFITVDCEKQVVGVFDYLEEKNEKLSFIDFINKYCKGEVKNVGKRING